MFPNSSTPTLTTIRTSIPKEFPIEGGPRFAYWAIPKLWYPHDYAEFVRDAVLLWPEIGESCEMVLECVKLELMLVVSTSGFWMVDWCMHKAGCVASTWEETYAVIQSQSLWGQIEFTEPTEENKERRRLDEAKRYHEELTKEEEAEVDEILEMAYARWFR